MSDAVVKALSELVPGGVTLGELDRGGGRALRWVEAGTGGPTVVLDAAAGTPALTWAPILPALAGHVRVVAYDRAGLGMSDPAPRLSAASAVADLTALLKETGQGPCVLVGNSWGGQLAQHLAWTATELVAGLVLVDPAHEDFDPLLGRIMESAFRQLLVLHRAVGSIERALRKPAVRSAVEVTDDPRLQDLLVQADLACYARDHQIRTAMAETRVPLRLRERWTKLQAQIAAEAVQGEHRVVRGAGHYIHRSRPAAVTEAVLAVIERARTR
ncbi:putative hydrolase (alpha/beta hydrolase fold) [Streptomyces spiroverticillatus]|uniref:Hydrolase (Alpha/beta hydrolase fold) n=1 Tax=Streptomyces finlayi TaxID=67296 RepID=A0A919CBI2_9ACTN|nr:alpha/beta hydrolase [Streptomyces finlayi]GHA18441.1 putative hydrolase (alpha/beta hydrolase fold) [Streptomyces spiroverticillatus]GHD00018.1 putative hydrolase (alpha/beta hydrolase fold) [Streptomyces finlayi]